MSYYLTQSDAEAGTPEIGPVYIMQLLMLGKFGFDLRILLRTASTQCH